MDSFRYRSAVGLSLLFHGAAWLFMLRHESHAARVRLDQEGKLAARAHLPALRDNATEYRATRLASIRAAAEALNRGAAPGDRPAGSPAPGSPPPAAAHPPTPTDTAARLAQSREDYRQIRERLIDAEARHLAKITGESAASARRKVEAAHPQPGAHGNRPADRDAGGQTGTSAATALNEIEAMENDAEQMLSRVVNLERTQSNGAPVRNAAEAEAERVLNQSQQFASETKQFQPVVDWTALMGRPVSVTSTNGTLDTGNAHDAHAGSARGLERDLQTRFQRAAKRIVFTRQIGARGTQPAEWVSPESWYIIGPFDNPRREAIDRTFPPEFEIDRDATYLGKGGRPISWAFVRTHDVAVIPPHPEEYAVYYAYTEIRSQAAMDCWLALGSDDHSKLWVNGLLIWSDTRNEKTWSPTEGFRRVHLNPGINRFLLRLENGWQGTMFSVALLLP